MDEKYYKDSIAYCLANYDNCRFKIFTDDKTLDSYKSIIKYLEVKNINHKFGNKDKHFINDFAELSICDVIISTPSTFSICAGFLRKKKDIIHSKEWIDSRVAVDDKFWVKLSKGGNDNYKIKEII